MNALWHHPRIAGAAAGVVAISFLAGALLPAVMPAALILTGVAVAVTAATLGARRVVAGTPATLLAAAGIAMALTGIVADHATRASLDAAFAVLGATGIFMIGTGAKLPAPLRLLLAGAGLAALVGHLAAVSGQASALDTVATAMPVSYPVLMSVIVLGWAAGTRVPAPTDTPEGVPA